MAGNTETRLDNSITESCVIASKELTCIFLTMHQLGHEIILGTDLLQQMGMQLILDGQVLNPTVPDFGCTLCTINQSSKIAELSEAERTIIEDMIAEEKTRFEAITGPTHLTPYRVKLKDPTPIKQRYRPPNPAMQRIIDEEVNRMLAEGVIEPSDSPWSSPVVLAKKKEGKYRFCIDFVKLNQVTEKDAYPLPQINAILDKLRGEGARYLFTIDLKNGYWQIPLTAKTVSR